MGIRKDSDEYWDLIRDLDKRYEKRELRPGEPRHQPAPNTTRHGGDRLAWWEVVLVVVAVLIATWLVLGIGMAGISSFAG